MKKRRYSDEEMIAQMQSLALKLGKTPSMADFDQNSKTISSWTAKHHFKTWNNFIKAAGLKVNHRYYSDDELMRQVRMLAEELGKTPFSTEFDKDPRTASSYIVMERFGSWSNFIEMAGLEVNDSYHRRDFTNEMLIAQVQMLASELGRSPLVKDFGKDPRTASTLTVRRRFGSWEAFMSAAGLEVSRRHYGKDELIAQVQMLASELGRTPSKKEFDRDKRTACSLTAINYFNSWERFIETAGLKVTDKRATKKGRV